MDIYNVEAAEILAHETLNLPIGEAAPIYEKLLATFPTAAKYWKQYVESYIVTNDEETAKQIFSRCLLTCPHINLWRCYINFIKKVNSKRGSEGLEETKKAFDFMLNYVGAFHSTMEAPNQHWELAVHAMMLHLALFGWNTLHS